MKFALIALAALLAAPAFAEVSAGSSSGSTAMVNPGTINSPLVNIGAAPGVTAGSLDNRVTTNQAASAGTVFVSPPVAGTCTGAGSGAAVQIPGGGVVLSKGGEPVAKCDTREDVVNLKWSGAPAEVVKARQCMDKDMAEAYARAGQPCVDQRPDARAAAILNEQPDPAPVAARPMPWQAGG